MENNKITKGIFWADQEGATAPPGSSHEEDGGGRERESDGERVQEEREALKRKVREKIIKN